MWGVLSLTVGQYSGFMLLESSITMYYFICWQKHYSEYEHFDAYCNRLLVIWKTPTSIDVSLTNLFSDTIDQQDLGQLLSDYKSSVRIMLVVDKRCLNYSKPIRFLHYNWCLFWPLVFNTPVLLASTTLLWDHILSFSLSNLKNF